MPVTKQTYTVATFWSAVDLAAAWRSAFIDAGLMTDWHDSFSSGGIENRVLRVQYNASKTYGTTFYWLMFTTSGVFIHVTTGWNTTTDVPAGPTGTGTQWLDWVSQATNATSNHLALSGTLSTTTPASIVRYTSATHTWFVSSQTSVRTCFAIQHPSHAPQPWLDLDRGYYAGFAYVGPNTEGLAGQIRFLRGPALRRDLTLGSAYVTHTSGGNFSGSASNVNLVSYCAPGNGSNNFDGNIYNAVRADGGYSPWNATMVNSVILPVGFSGTNPAYAVNSNPVFHSMPYSPYSTVPLNSDFGVTFHYANNTLNFQDRLIVTAGVEEWEILAVANNSTAIVGVSPAFLARVV